MKKLTILFVTVLIATAAFAQDEFGKVGAIGFSTGLNIRYSVLMIGFEFNTISPKLEDLNNEGEYFGNVNETNSDKSPLPSVNFTVGLNF